MIVLKIGGSVITDKDTPETVDEGALDRSAGALEGIDDVVVVHGGGSFGHPVARDHGVSRTEGSDDPGAVVSIHDAMLRLNARVIGAFHEHGVPALPVTPLSVASRDGDDKLSVSVGTVRRMLAEGFVPVLHGDVVTHTGRGATIVSGDELVVALADDLDADRVGLCTSVPGVLDANDTVIPRIESFDNVADQLGESGATDVTGGMAAKVRALLTLERPAAVFGLEGLVAFLDGDMPGTLITGDS